MKLRTDYEQMGREAITALLRVEHAAHWLEIEARISDRPYAGFPRHVEPLHLSNSRRQLLADGAIERDTGAARGGREVTLWRLTGERRNRRAVTAALGRKRLLMARYLGWASGSPTHPTITGPAAERVVHNSLREAAPFGYRLAEPSGAPVSWFLGGPVPIGPLDNAALHTLSAGGVPGAVVALPVEVKNLRDWLYPWSGEPYQLLDKAARLQMQHPDQPMVPLLIARRLHFTTFREAKAHGFLGIETKRHYIAATVDEEALAEVRVELGFLDLVAETGPDDLIVRRLVTTLPKELERSAERWRRSAEGLRYLFAALREESQTAVRRGLVHDLRHDAQALHDLGETPGW